MSINNVTNLVTGGAGFLGSHLIDKLIEKGEEVKLSSFGTFSVQSKRERVGRNPKTGVEARITPRRVLSFRPSHILKDRVDGKL